MKESMSNESFATSENKNVSDTEMTIVEAEEIVSNIENTMIISKKFRRKSMKNMSLKPDKNNDYTMIDANNNTDVNLTSSDEKMTSENSRLTTEVIDIEKEFVRAKSCHERHGMRRKKAKLDQLLSQVEAKHDKLKNTNSSTPITPAENNDTKSSSHFHASDTKKTPSISNDCFSSTISSSENIVNVAESRLSLQPKNQITSSVFTKRSSKNQTKPNKRTLSTNERYSKLTSTQLQRRLIANARERSRVHALSNAFDALRCTIPSYSTEQKLSKLTILRVAINYINALVQVLNPAPSFEDQRDFKRYVDECTDVLQTEYGRSKNK